MDEVTHVSVETLFRDMAEQLNLQWVAGRNGGQRRQSGVANARFGQRDRFHATQAGQRREHLVVDTEAAKIHFRHEAVAIAL